MNERHASRSGFGRPAGNGMVGTVFDFLAETPDLAALRAAHPDLADDDLRACFGAAAAATRGAATVRFRKGAGRTAFARTHGLPDPDPAIHKGTVFRGLLALFKPGRLLDLGTGKGNFAVAAAELGWSVTAVDARTVRWPDAVAEPDPHRAALIRGIRWVQADVRDFPIVGGAHDLVCVLGLLHHLEVPDQVALLRRCAGTPTLLDTRIAPANADRVDGYEGVLVREHGETRAERDAVPQAAWGNPVSFQHTEESLLRLVLDCGFAKAWPMRPPHRRDYTFYLLLPTATPRARLDRRAARRTRRRSGG